MRIGSFSTLSKDFFLSSFTREMRDDLEKYTYETDTGRHYKMGRYLGYKTNMLVDIHNNIELFESFKSTNALVANDMKVADEAIKALISGDDKKLGIYDQFMKAILADPTLSTYKAIGTSAHTAFSGLLTSINADSNGKYIFGGTNILQMPLPADKVNKAIAEITEKLKKFAGVPSDGDFSKADQNKIVEFFNSKEFTDYFEPKQKGAKDGDANWSKFSNATDDRIQVRVLEDGETVNGSSSANVLAFREAMKCVLMVKIGSDCNLPAQTQVNIMKSAQKVLLQHGEAAFNEEQVILGASEVRIKQANDFIDTRVDLLSKEDISLGGVDAEETASKAQEIAAHIQISYQMTSQWLKLSLFNYI